MMKKINIKKLLVFLLFNGIISISFSQWSFQTSNTTSHLWDVCFWDANNGWVVGNDGTILHTSNGGELWSLQNSGTALTLKAVCFPDENVGYIVGGNAVSSVVLKSTDGGLSWYNQPAGIELGLIDCFFISIDTGYIVTGEGMAGNEIFKTTDGGLTWISLNISDTTTYAQSIHFVNSDCGFTVGYGMPNDIDCVPMILKTIDGGNSWLDVTPNIGNYELQSVFMVDENTVYVVGDTNYIGTNPGRVLKTIDGGLNWDVTNIPAYIATICFTTESTGYIPTLWDVYKTTDSGLTWNQQTIDSIPQVAYHKYAISFPTPDSGYIVGGMGTILKTVNGGGTMGITDATSSLSSLNVFPNPASSKITIELFNLPKKNNSLTVYSLNGQLLISQSITKPQTEIDFSHLPNGIYFVKVWNDKDVMVRKVIKR